MAIKTFNINEKIHKDYSDYCKKEGISMSKKIENFIKQELESLKNKQTNQIHQSNPKINHQDSSAKINQEENSFSKYCN